MSTSKLFFCEGATVNIKKLVSKKSVARDDLLDENVIEEKDEIAAVREAEKAEREAEKKRKRAKRRRARRIWDRIAGFFIATGIVVGCSCLALEYILVKGPSESLRDIFVNTMDETRRFKFIPRIFLTEEEYADIKRTQSKTAGEVVMDQSLIKLPTEEADKPENNDGKDAYGLVDEDGDGIIYQEIRRGSFAGNMCIILDPKRVFVGMPDNYGGVGLTVEEMCLKYDAIGGINAGGFKDDDGTGLGGFPQGLTIIDGYCYNDEAYTTDGTAGFDLNGLMHVGYFTYDEAVENNIVNCVSFGPILISNGIPTDPQYLSSGVNPRTAIAQRADGAVIMLVIDGRQAHSAGATYQDVVDLLLDYGAVNALNLDGGSSTVMWYQGQYVNKCSAAYGTSRPLPTAFLFK